MWQRQRTFLTNHAVSFERRGSYAQYRRRKHAPALALESGPNDGQSRTNARAVRPARGFARLAAGQYRVINSFSTASALPPPQGTTTYSACKGEKH